MMACLTGNEYCRKTVRQMTQNQLPNGVFAYRVFGFGYGFKVQLSDWGKRAVKENTVGMVQQAHFWIVPSKDLIVIALSRNGLLQTV